MTQPAQIKSDGFAERFVDFTSALAKRLRAQRVALSNEMKLHDIIESALADCGIEALREHSLSPQDRADFFLPQYECVVEVKKNAADIADLRQIGRYLENPECRECVVIALRAHSLPHTFLGKRVHRISMATLLL